MRETVQTLYAEYYCESKIILKARKDGFHPGIRNCGCYFNFQPKQIKEGSAYKTLVDESKAILSSTLASPKDLYLKGLKLNNKDRKAELIELLCAALLAFANLVLIECRLEKVLEPHELVADLLLQHHDELFDDETTTMEYFTKKYCSYNNRRHEPKSKNELFKLRFPQEVETIAVTAKYFAGATTAPSKTAAAKPYRVRQPPNPPKLLLQPPPLPQLPLHLIFKKYTPKDLLYVSRV
jgi:hypothetical protein